MKLRILGNAIRLRLTVGEVAAIARGEPVEEVTALGERRFAYSLTPVEGGVIDATFDGDVIRVTAPRAEALGWAGSDQVSLRGAAGPVSILIEKDFDCLEPRAGDEDLDTFPNPARAAEG